MKDEDAKVLIGILEFLEGDFIVLKHVIEDSILDIPKAIDGNFHFEAWFFDNDRMDDNFFQIGMFSKVIGVVGDMEEIAYGEFSKIVGRVVMIAMDGKDGELDVHVIVLEVNFEVWVV